MNDIDLVLTSSFSSSFHCWSIIVISLILRINNKLSMEYIITLCRFNWRISTVGASSVGRRTLLASSKTSISLPLSSIMLSNSLMLGKQTRLFSVALMSDGPASNVFEICDAQV